MSSKFSIIFTHQILLILLIINKSFSIIIPIKTYIPPYNDTNITEYWTSRQMYSNIELGTPSQNVLLFLSFKENSFYLEKINQNNKINGINSEYNYNKSSSKELLSEFDESYGKFRKCGAFISDDFYFNEKIDEPKKKFEKISFFLSSKNDTELSFTLGIGLQKKLKDKGFFDELKEKKYIKSYDWFLNYKSNDEILLIIGQKIHEYYPKYYSENQILPMNSYCSSTYLKWGILFNKIFINNTTFSDLLDSELDFNYGAIIVPSDYWDYIIEIYFKEYIKLNICTMETNSDKLRYFYCNQNNFSKRDINKAPSFKFYSVQFNYTFEIKGEDLFEFKNNKYYFLMFSQTFSYSWVLGKPFLKKFTFLFNIESRTISFYNPNIPYKNSFDNIENKINQNYIWIIILLIVILVAIVIFVIIFLTKTQKHRKARTNELDDEYAYKSNDIIDKINNLF